MDLQPLSEACFASPVDFSRLRGDELVRDLQACCQSALADAGGAHRTHWRPAAVKAHRSMNAALGAGAATATGWVERIADDGALTFRVTAVSTLGVERLDVSFAFVPADPLEQRPPSDDAREDGARARPGPARAGADALATTAA